MKKSILMCMIAAMFFACKSASSTASSSEATTLSTKLDKSTQVALKGNWVLTNVSYPGSDYIKVNSFDLADSKCFIGSKWKFVSMSNKGSLTLNSPSCTAYSTPITWFINKEGEFVLKILDEAKAKTVKSGYVLRVANQTEKSFQLVDQINVAGKMTAVVYQFDKIN